MTDIYERLGIAPIINAKGPATRLSGNISRPEVRAAMAEAMTRCVDIVELQARASELIAKHTGAEAGLVTSGAAAGLLLGAAACVTRLDPGAMSRLPLTGDSPGEIVMVRSQRNQYDHALRTTGLKIVEVGLADRYAGAGCRDAEPWEIADAITESTRLVHWVADAHSQPPLEAVVEVAHARGLPVVVDAAAQLPPRAALKTFIAAGADLVAFSGGKALAGPQASGILCGRRDLIAAAALQMLDMDYPEGFFRPPPAFIDMAKLSGTPRHGIGRPCKVAKEQIVGLMVALELFVAEEDEVRHARWLDRLTRIAEGLGGLSGATVGIDANDTVPTMTLKLEGGAPAAVALYETLLAARPAIHLGPDDMRAGRLMLNPMCLTEDDIPPLVDGLRAALAS